METINDIVREVAAEMLNTSMQEIAAERIHGWATRLGDAATCKDSLQVGNAAAMREALLKIRKVMDEMSKSIFQGWIEDSLVDIMGEAQRAISSALSAPPRNCDRYANYGDALEAFEKQMRSENRLGFINPFIEVVRWLFAEMKGENK